MKTKGNTLQTLFRVGKYGIQQIPRNIVVGEIGLDGKCNERIIQSTKTYHSNYETALLNVFNRLLQDNMAKNTLNSMRGVLDSIEEAKQEILDELRK